MHHALDDLRSDELHSPAEAIEKIFEVVRRVKALLGKEPTIIHIPANTDRTKQVFQLESATEENRRRLDIVIVTSFPDVEVIRWPSQNWSSIIKCDRAQRGNQDRSKHTSMG